jgi:hypothetical protein
MNYPLHAASVSDSLESTLDLFKGIKIKSQIKKQQLGLTAVALMLRRGSGNSR